MASFIDFAKQSDTYVVDTSSKHPATVRSWSSAQAEKWADHCEERSQYESAASLPIERGLETYGTSFSRPISVFGTLRPRFVADVHSRSIAAASKVLSETLAWDFMLLNKPHFTLTTLGPAWVMGEHPEPTVKSLAELGSSPGATARAVLDCEEVMSTPIHVSNVILMEGWPWNIL